MLWAKEAQALPRPLPAWGGQLRKRTINNAKWKGGKHKLTEGGSEGTPTLEMAESGTVSIAKLPGKVVPVPTVLT